jgi:hypothetical protein
MTSGRVDGYEGVKYTRAVRRGLAGLIVLSLYSLQVHALAFHVHANSDHAEESDHQHGPAIHHHDDLEHALHVDTGNSSAGGAAITIAVPVGIGSAVIAVHAELAEVLPIPELQHIGDMRTIEVRSHGPPPARNSFLRGPPTSALP